ncbi:MAG TPA: septation protein IspZ [Caulobacteraceae bacterium]|nr:septation protein IspZ [Caulobacteraceae bacterium]
MPDPATGAGEPGQTAWRGALDAAPAFIFLIVLLATHNFRLATWFVVAGAAIALSVRLVRDRRIAPLPAFTGVMALAFGGASLVFRRADILQMKMTIVDGALGALLFGGLAIRRNPLKHLLGGALKLTDEAWAKLAVRYGLFWWASAIANEFVRRTQSTETWAAFRVGAIIAAVLFALAQTPFLMKNAKTEIGVEPPDVSL